MKSKLASAGRLLRRLRWVPLLAMGALGSLLLPVPSGAQNATPSEGLVCSTSPSSSFLLSTQVGYITTPDGNALYMWGYGLGSQGFQYPGPVLCVDEGASVTITLKNNLPVPSSVVFPGLTQVKADGKPVSLDVASNSLAKPAGANGGSVTYTFTASDPGTFLYESGTDPELQTRMGLVGALVVRPHLNLGAPVGTSYVYDDPSSAYNSNKEFMHLLTEIDPHMHHAIEVELCQSAPDPACAPTPPAYDMTRYLPRYFMINGRSFPDTITPNFSTAVPTQPYGALVHVLPKNNDPNSIDYNPLPAVVRFLNAGPVNYPFHPHSNHDDNIGLDGRLLVNPHGGPSGTSVNISYDHFGFVVTPGQTAEALFNWTDAQNWNPDTNPVGVPIPSAQNRADGPFWSGSPYLGIMKPLLNGITQWNQCGEYYHFAHSHDLVHVTNYGAPGGGMLTLIRVDPPPSVQKQYGQNCNGGPGWN